MNNPPAFPIPDVRTHDGFGVSEGSPGMTLRDWFAAHAPEPSRDRIAIDQGADRGRNPHNDSYKPALRSEDQIKAQLAYRYADAMLAARAEVQA